MNSNEFLDRVMEVTGIRDSGRAIEVTRAVFDSLRSMIQQDTSDHVAEQLPADLWPLGPMESVSQLVPTFRSFDVYGFLSRVQNEARLDDTGKAEQMSRAIFNILHSILDARTITMIANDLPGDMRIMWTGAAGFVPPEDVEEPSDRTTTYSKDEAVVPTDTGTATPRIETREDLPIPQIEGEAMPTGTPRELAPDQAQPRPLPEEAEDLTVVSEPRPLGPESGIFGQTLSDTLAAEHYQAEKQLAEEIERLLELSDEVDASDINVQVMHGEVILRGRVKTEREREAALRVVNDALESSSVRNEIYAEE